MRKPFINAQLLSLSLLLGACASAPPLAESQRTEQEQVREHVQETAQKQERTAGPDEESLPGEGVALHASPHSAVPPLKSGSQALFDRGVTYLREGRLEEAQALFVELTEEQPELAGPWANLGHIHLARREEEQAKAAFERAVQANPYNCNALNQLGVLARRVGEFAQAEQHYRACIAAQPHYPHAHLNLAILYELYMGRLGDALVAYSDYQLALAEPDVRVNGWMMDLERRVAAIAKR